MDSKICSNCHEKNNPTFVLCWKCGHLLANLTNQADNLQNEENNTFPILLLTALSIAIYIAVGVINQSFSLTGKVIYFLCGTFLLMGLFSHFIVPYVLASSQMSRSALLCCPRCRKETALNLEQCSHCGTRLGLWLKVCHILSFECKVAFHLFSRSWKAVGNLTDNFDPGPILEAVYKKYGGRYQKGGLGNSTFVEFDFHHRKFWVGPDIQDSLISYVGSDIVGISFSCQLRKDLPFSIIKRNAFNSAESFQSEQILGDYLFVADSRQVQETLLKNQAFVSSVESLKGGMLFLTARQNNFLWYSNQTYHDGIIEKLDNLAMLLEQQQLPTLFQ